MPTISQRELRNDSGEVMRRVLAGESFTVTRRGVPVADLVPHRGEVVAGPTTYVPAERIAQALGDAPAWDVAAFADERRALDGGLDDASRDPWVR